LASWFRFSFSSFAVGSGSDLSSSWPLSLVLLRRREGRIPVAGNGIIGNAALMAASAFSWSPNVAFSYGVASFVSRAAASALRSNESFGILAVLKAGQEERHAIGAMTAKAVGVKGAHKLRLECAPP
jgi:hypothetical protein